jgi:WD40 repeat protein
MEGHLYTLESYTNRVRAVAVTPDGQRAISASWDMLKVWDLEQGKLIASFRGDGELAACAIAPDAMTIVAGERLGRVHFLRLEGVS